MDVAMVIFRVVHVVAGVFWAGAVFYFVTLAGPAIREAGPEGGKVMQALIRRRQLEILPLLAGLTILSGLWLLWRVSGGFERSWFGAPAAHALLLGMVTSLVAFGIGFFGMRPAMLRAGPAMQAAMQAREESERQARLAEAQALQARARSMGRAVAVLLLVAVVTMAMAGYV
jgi:hypothetical protein